MWEFDTRGSKPTFNIWFLLTVTPSFPWCSLRLRSHLQPADDWRVALLLVNASNDSVTFSPIMNIIGIIRRQSGHVRHLQFTLLFDQSKQLHVMCCHGNWCDLDGYTYMAYTKKAMFLISNGGDGPLRAYWSETQGCFSFLDTRFTLQLLMAARSFDVRHSDRRKTWWESVHCGSKAFCFQATFLFLEQPGVSTHLLSWVKNCLDLIGWV